MALSPWRSPLRRRFLVVHLLIVSVPVLGIALSPFYEREALRALENELAQQAKVLRQSLVAQPALPSGAEAAGLLRRAGSETGARFRLLDASGRVVADSDPTFAFTRHFEANAPPAIASRYESRAARFATGTAPPGSDALAARAEIAAALGGRYAAQLRRAREGGPSFVCAALPIATSTEPTRAPPDAVRGVLYVTRSSAPVYAAMTRVRTALLVVFGASLLFSLLSSLWLARGIVRPLEQLTFIAAGIAAGDRSNLPNLKLERKDELGQLSSAFAAMARQLDARAQDVAELASNLSHELKSPMTSIRGATELLLEGAAQDPEARERFLRNMLADVQRMDRLVSRLLELTRIEAEPSPEGDVELSEVVRAACHARGGAQLEVHTEPVLVRGRREHLESAVGNLVDNALQHAREGTRVTVALRRVEPHARVTVHNRGDAIPEAHRARLFERFFTTRVREGGSGVGLALVKSVVTAHGGRVGFESDEAAGTTFWFELSTKAAWSAGPSAPR